jgi:1-acyl-sn-glycerol-3-phosphate acyltransferase
MAEIGALDPGAAADPGSALLGALRLARLAAIVTGITVEHRLLGDGKPVETFARRAHRTARALLGAHGVDVRRDGPPCPSGPAIIVANHVSYLDPLLISAVTPCVSIAKAESEQWPLIGGGLRALGCIFVRRGDAWSGARALRRTLRAVRGGAAVLNFPEGTTTDGRDVGPFQPGIFGAARLARVPIVPAHIAYDDERVAWFGGQTFVPHYTRVSRVARFVAHVRFCEPIDVRDLDEPKEIAERARAAIAACRH